MIKLYLRDDSGAPVAYYELWVEPANRRILTHWGDVGREGTAEPHRIQILKSLDAQVDSLLAPARGLGYRELEDGEAVPLIIEYAVNDTSRQDAEDAQDDLADRVTEILGWTGLGTCEDTVLDKNTLQVHCRVVNADLAPVVLTDGLKDGAFSHFSRIFAP